MANSISVAAVALSLRELLRRSFADLDASDPNAFRTLPGVELVRTDDYEEIDTSPGAVIRFPTLAIFCYRVDVNRTMRSSWAAVAHHDGVPHLPLDLHFLLTPFDTEAEAELKILGATMMTLERTPILSGPRLHPQGGWEPGDSIQLINEDLVTEDVMRTFDTLPTEFRLSVSYLARITRVDAPVEPDHPDVLTAVRGLSASSQP